MLNSVRFSFVRTREAAVTSNSTPPLDFFPGSGRQNGSVGPAPLSPIGASGTVPFFIVQNKFFGGDDVLWTHGSHSLKMGVSVGRVQTNLGAPFNVGGNFLFGGIVPFLQAHPFLFLGMSAPSPDFSINRYFREIDMFPYVQDDWKVTPRLTLNLGLRYEFVTNAVGVGVPLFVILNPLTSSGFTQVKHVLASNPNNKSFDPRIGLAFDPFNDHKTAIRAGFGIFHEPVSPRTYAPSYYLAPPSGATLVLDLSFIPGLPPLGFPNPYAGGSLPYSAFAGLDYHTDTAPYVMQYNLTIEHQIAAGTVASIGYIGSSGVHLFSERNQNLPQTTTGSPVGAGTPANPFTGALTNPAAAAIGGLNNDAATSHSTYHSLQATLNRQFSKNVLAQASYTYAKCIDDGSVSYGLEQGAYEVTNPYNQGYDRGRCSYDITQSLVVNGLYSLPFRGNRIVDGWKLTEVLSTNTGLPVNIQDGFNQARVGGIEGPRPDYNPNPPTGCHPNQIINQKLPNGSVQWFNPQCYVLQPFGTNGNVGRDTVNGPGLLSLDFGILKDTRISERVNVQFRAEFFNVINHTNLGAMTPPGNFVFAGAAGPAPAPITALQPYSPTAGQINTLSTSSRQVQFALKFIF